MPRHHLWLLVAALGLMTGCAGIVTLHQAAERGDTATLQSILVQGESPDQVDNRGRTPLHRAAKKGRIGAARQLIEYGARIDAVDEDGETALFLASEKRRVAMVQLLLAHRANPDIPNHDRRTPLMEAARKDEPEIVRMLLEAGADTSARDEDRETALMIAAGKRNLRVVGLLLASNANPNTPDRDQRTPLFYAVDQRDQEMVEQLLEAGADPNIDNRDGVSPLARAVDHRDVEIVEALLEHRADPDATTSSRDPVLSVAVRNKDVETTKLLLEAGANPSAPGNDGRPPLITAAQNRDSVIVELLMRAGAKPKVWDAGGQSPLYYAVQNRDHSTAEALLEHGAPPDQQNKNGARPIVVAYTNKDHSMVDMLIESGAEPIGSQEAFLDPSGFMAKYGLGSLIKASIANASVEMQKSQQAQAGTGSAPSSASPPPQPPIPRRPDLEDAAQRMPTGVSDVEPDRGGFAKLKWAPKESYYSRRVAVVVGIDDYEKWPMLEGAGRDARRVSETLRARGFDEVIEIYDRDATRRRILSVLGTELAKATDENSMALIYFAGHGETETLPNGDKRGYIIPADGDPNQVFATAISMDTLRSISSRLPAKQVYYAMDSCYSGLGFTRGLSIPRVANQDYIKKITSLHTVQMITAGAEGERALEQDGQGIFTRYFLRALEGEADLDGDGWVTASEIGTYVRPQVTNASRSRQTPRFGTLEGNGEIVFAVGKR